MAVAIPMANEENEFDPFVSTLKEVFNRLGFGTAYFVIDNVSKDRTLELCKELSSRDSRFVTIWAPENRNVVDAYLRGIREAYERGHELIIEMDAGMSHDPRALTKFIRVLNEGNECAFGSRFINGGSMADSSFFRVFMSKAGTICARVFLGAKMHDMTSGFQGFHREIVRRFIDYPFRSKAHFYQTEIRYLLRKTRYLEIPIHYRAPSNRISKNAITDSIKTLMYYMGKRFSFDSVAL
jgi:dolichol-phosphate mannosyltransferase